MPVPGCLFLLAIVASLCLYSVLDRRYANITKLGS